MSINNTIVVIYIVTYVLYIVFGHRFVRNIVYQQENKEYSKSVADVVFRGFYLCYIAMLYNAYYFYNPTKETYYNAIVINVLSILLYAYKYGKHQIDGVLLHIVYGLPLIMVKQKRLDTGYGFFSVFTIAMLLSYRYFCNILLQSTHPYLEAENYFILYSYCNFTQ